MLTFKLDKVCDKTAARAGEITTDHGVIKTPIFMPVGTVGSVKAVHMPELKNDIKAQIILGNTYHLYLRPGLETLEMAGGLHKFNSWDGPILTDSGGYQVFSLSDSRKITEEGVTFRSHIDGSKQLFTPERVLSVLLGLILSWLLMNVVPVMQTSSMQRGLWLLLSVGLTVV